MLSSDEKIFNLIVKKKKDGDELLQHFNISYPSKRIATESNSIYVASVSSEPNQEVFDGTEYRDLVEILVVTKIKDYKRAIKVIKTVISKLIKIIKESEDFDVRPIVRNIAPEYNPNFVLNKGHIMVECITEIEPDISDETIEKVCDIILEEVEEK